MHAQEKNIQQTEALVKQPETYRIVARCFAQQASDGNPFALPRDVVKVSQTRYVLDAYFVSASKEAFSFCC